MIKPDIQHQWHFEPNPLIPPQAPVEPQGPKNSEKGAILEQFRADLKLDNIHKKAN